MTLTLVNLIWLPPLYVYWLWLEPEPLLNVHFRSSLLLIVALAAGFVLRGRRPEVRIAVYRVAWLSVLGITLLVGAPLVSRFGSPQTFLFHPKRQSAARWNIALYSSPPKSAAASLVLPSAPAHRTVSPLKEMREPIRLEAPVLRPGEATRNNLVDRFIGVLVVVWPLVSFWLLLRLAWCHGKIALLRRRATFIEDETTIALLRAACLAVGVKAPRLVASIKARGPFLCGIRRPAIVLPKDFASQFDDAALRAIFLHEAAHLRNCDCAWTYLRRFVGALLWPQPLLWILSHKTEATSEEACDLAVIEGGCAPRDYATCLLDLAERLCLSKTERTVGAGVLPLRSALGRRVQNILKGVPQGAKRVSRAAKWSLACGALCLIAISVSFAVDAVTAPLPTGRATGRVVYQNGKPVSGVFVWPRMLDADETRLSNEKQGLSGRRLANLNRMSYCIVGNTGEYELEGLAGEKFNIYVSGDAEGVTAGPKGWAGAARTVKIIPGQNVRVPDIVLTPGALVEGRFVDAVSGQALPGFAISCYGPHRPSSTSSYIYTQTDSSGHFSLRVPPGKSRILWTGPFQWPGRRVELHYGDSPPYEKDLIVVKSSGQLYGSSDWVEMRADNDAPRFVRSGDTDGILFKEGQTRHLTFRVAPLNIYQRDGKLPIVKMLQRRPTPGHWPLPRMTQSLPQNGTASISGLVLNANGQPAANVSVDVQMQDESLQQFWDVFGAWGEEFDKLPAPRKAILQQTVRTETDGTYRFNGLTDASYDIILRLWDEKGQRTPDLGWLAPPISGVTARSGQTVAAPTMRGVRGAILQGRVLDADSGKGLPEAFLPLRDGRWPTSNASIEFADADKTGRYSIRVMPRTVNLGLNFYGVSFGNRKAIRIAGRDYDFYHTSIYLDGKPSKTGTELNIPLRDGQTRNVDFRLPRTEKAAQ